MLCALWLICKTLNFRKKNFFQALVNVYQCRGGDNFTFAQMCPRARPCIKLFSHKIEGAKPNKAVYTSPPKDQDAQSRQARECSGQHAYAVS